MRSCSIANRSFSLSRNKKLNCAQTIQWKDKSNTFLQLLGLCVYPNFRYSLKRFAEIYRAQYENANWCTSVVHQYGGRNIA